ncbi:SCO1860 family LAETG-anchored protein [Streptacidiphilus cavernicola]|uniref:SCO1860 family LAETG-anchored protein n=1 Tax=Streptacidiphilus cavernicola TaxID=3342716 RepID=A0ABV6W1C2_9ACTN
MLVFRRSAAALGALAAVALVAATGQSAVADTPPAGTASAVTARVGLDVTLLNSVDVPIDVSLNAVHAPQSADGNLLTATVQGLKGGGSAPQTLVDAALGHSAAIVDKDGARASVDLVTADVKLPGLLLRDLLKVQEVKASADCPAHGRPSAAVNVLGDVTVLGTKVSLSAVGPTHVAVPGIGVVDVEFSQKEVTSRTAAATALGVTVTVNPGGLNVLKVSGSVQLASVSCEMGKQHGGGTPPVHTTAPGAPSSSAAPTTGAGNPPPPTSAPAEPVSVTSTVPAGTDASPAPARVDLAETGGGSSAPMITGVALVLVGAGTGAVVLTRRRRRTH